MTATAAPYRSDLPRGRDGFAQLLRAEWIKFRTVRGWVIASLASTVMIILFAWLATHQHELILNCNRPISLCRPRAPHVPVGPSGEAVTDTYYFVHRTVEGNGSITVRVSDLVGVDDGVQPWAKAGLIVTDSTTPGSAYAAVMVTGAHGVHMQYDYTHDAAASAGVVGGRSPQWLRLTRSGGTLMGYASADGTHWAKIGTAHLAGFPATAYVGLFVTSPETAQLGQQLGGSGGFNPQATAATASFDRVGLQGAWRAGAWEVENVGAGSNPFIPTVTSRHPVHRSSGGFTITGSGDIAPAVGNEGAYTAQESLYGVFAGLILLIIVATMFITAEYRRGLIQTTFAASPRRGRVLAAKAVVVGLIAFAAGAAGAAIAIPLGEHLLRANGDYVYPTTTLTDLRVVLGTGALVGLTAVLAVALGSALRRSAGTVCAVIALIVLPYVLAIASALPAGASQWLMRLTPAAAFAVQQTLPQYHQVNYLYTPANGFYPLAPGAGLAVLGGYALVALAVASYLLRRRDA
jgi:ABC-type transport system involved in multi-copper enzyme maturation permease subunit